MTLEVLSTMLQSAGKELGDIYADGVDMLGGYGSYIAFGVTAAVGVGTTLAWAYNRKHNQAQTTHSASMNRNSGSDSDSDSDNLVYHFNPVAVNPFKAFVDSDSDSDSESDNENAVNHVDNFSDSDREDYINDIYPNCGFRSGSK